MFPNLEAEQARHSHTNAIVAEKLELSRASYESKKKSGKFNVTESRKLCEIYKKNFEYLFATEIDDMSA